MSNEIDKTIFARLSDDKSEILEYPVIGLNIRNRAHPFDWYTKVVFEQRPEVPRFYTLKESLRIMDTVVYATYSLQADTLNQVLAALAKEKNVNKSLTAPDAPVLFEDLDTVAIDRIKELAMAHVQKKLDEFAALKGYDNIVSACSYVGSKVSAHKADAEKCVDVRDDAWVAVNAYFNSIATGELAVPASSDDIDAILPAMNW